MKSTYIGAKLIEYGVKMAAVAKKKIIFIRGRDGLIGTVDCCVFEV